MPVGAAARDALARWLGDRAQRSRRRTSTRCSSAARGTRLSPRAIQQRLARVGGAAGPRPARASAHAAPFVRLARAAVVGRPARGAGDAGPRAHRQHAGLHASRFPGAGQGLRRRASAREEEGASGAEAPVVGPAGAQRRPGSSTRHAGQPAGRSRRDRRPPA